ncbi:STAS domain-containing protein [Pararobbsia silviterrae]|uniref:STAS domain-containing protein n=1 Tax=Pararobbsia silviterrae TaxID=1792498 RepID=A0A494X5S4_9BURK|nr:STAS domain-containing protein [Pararobbsia silviterrae]RKP45730.1 STAS domain-containing protein [Pararobbsia silviterrae]
MGAHTQFETGARLTFETAKAVLDAGLSRIAAGATQVDCAPLEHFDSSALAVLLAWRRAAQERGADLAVAGLPAGLASLAEAYGVTPLIVSAV